MNTMTRSAAVAIVAPMLACLALLVPAAHMFSGGGFSGGHGAPAMVSVADSGAGDPGNEDWG
jgi:hypothetical protein